MSLLVIILTVYSGLFFQAGEGDTIIKNNLFIWFIFFAVFSPTLVFAVNFVLKMRIEILKVLAQKSTFMFRLITFNSIELRDFKKQYMDFES